MRPNRRSFKVSTHLSTSRNPPSAHRHCGVLTRDKEDLVRIFKRARNQLLIGTPHDPVEGGDRLYQGCQNRFFDVVFRSLSEAFSERFFPLGGLFRKIEEESIVRDYQGYGLTKREGNRTSDLGGGTFPNQIFDKTCTWLCSFRVNSASREHRPIALSCGRGTMPKRKYNGYPVGSAKQQAKKVRRDTKGQLQCALHAAIVRKLFVSCSSKIKQKNLPSFDLQFSSSHRLKNLLYKTN